MRVLRVGLIYAIFARQMKQNTLQITSASTGEGQERICYLHSDDANLSPLAISEVNRRWESFFKQFNIRSAEMIEVCGSSPKVLEANYRKTV
jgi:tRNA threonylcarbamoyladenosine modification (KEOPS) complex Cgi121 subunit